jgi:transcriptional regulator NrdR family protein
MLCPKCHEKTAVLENRDRDLFIYRRRKCCGCGFRFSTQELIIERPAKVAPKEPKQKTPVKVVHKKSSTFSKKPSSYYIEDDEVLFPTDIGIDISGTRDWD